MCWVTSYSDVYLFRLIICSFLPYQYTSQVLFCDFLSTFIFNVSYLLASIQYSHTFYSTANLTYAVCNLTVCSCLTILQEHNISLIDFLDFAIYASSSVASTQLPAI